MLRFLITVGNSATSNLIGNGLLALLRQVDCFGPTVTKRGLKHLHVRVDRRRH